MKKANLVDGKLSTVPEGRQKTGATEGLRILAKMIARTYMTGHIATRPDRNITETIEPAGRNADSRENDNSNHTK